MSDSVTEREYFERILIEHDRLYDTRFKAADVAVSAALAAAKEQTAASFAASEKAILKSDANAEKWRENANEWRGAMMDRESKFASRSEMDNEFKSLRTELESLKESRASGAGKASGVYLAWTVAIAGIALVASIASILRK